MRTAARSCSAWGCRGGRRGGLCRRRVAVVASAVGCRRGALVDGAGVLEDAGDSGDAVVAGCAALERRQARMPSAPVSAAGACALPAGRDRSPAAPTAASGQHAEHRTPPTRPRPGRHPRRACRARRLPARCSVLRVAERGQRVRSAGLVTAGVVRAGGGPVGADGRAAGPRRAISAGPRGRTASIAVSSEVRAPARRGGSDLARGDPVQQGHRVLGRPERRAALEHGVERGPEREHVGRRASPAPPWPPPGRGRRGCRSPARSSSGTRRPARGRCRSR